METLVPCGDLLDLVGVDDLSLELVLVLMRVGVGRVGEEVTIMADMVG